MIVTNDTSAAKSVLVLNQDVSGMNPFLFREVRKSWNVNVKEVLYPDTPRRFRMLTTIHPNIKTWKRRHGNAMRLYHTSAACFKARSRYARKAVLNNPGANAILQIGCMFDGLSSAPVGARLLFASYNTTLAYREWKPWAPFGTDKEFQEWYELEKKCYTNADAIICTNRYVMQSFVRDYGIDPSKLHYIGYGLNFESLPDVCKDQERRVALFVGYDFARKGGPSVVEAFRSVRRIMATARLRIVGPTSLDPKYLGEGIEYVPPVRDRDEMQRHFTEASFFVMPSICEPFGLVFLEAMACKNACIGSKRNAMPEIIEEGKTGFLVEPGDVDQLAKHMFELFSAPELAREMGDAAYRRVNEQFTWEVCGRRVQDVLRSITDGKMVDKGCR